jgi:hypothetical protein
MRRFSMSYKKVDAPSKVRLPFASYPNAPPMLVLTPVYWFRPLTV